MENQEIRLVVSWMGEGNDFVLDITNGNNASMPISRGKVLFGLSPRVEFRINADTLKKAIDDWPLCVSRTPAQRGEEE